MRPSQPTTFVFKKRDTCAVCNNIAPCPVCAKGTQCQQIFRSSCQDCPVNKCVPIPDYNANSGPNKSALGGGLAALFIIAIFGGAAFWYWKKLQAKRRRIALHEEALERREKVKNEKEATTLQLGGSRGDSDFALVDDGDTEYTQVTGVLNNNEDSLVSLAEPTAFRRRSFGAATHLSRITEGVEEEEEEEEINADGKSIRTTRKRKSTSTRSFASGAGPRISISSGTSSFGSHNLIPIAFKPSTTNEGNPDGYESVSPLPLPSTAHRALGAPVIQVNQSRAGPIRPTRAPDLNLRLPEAPHRPATSSPLAAVDHSEVETLAEPYDFMSIDPASALNSSLAYTRADRHLSSATINTIGSVQSGSLSYVLSAPQVITPVSGEGVRRVQVGNGGKAQLVKVPSVKRKEKAVDSDPFSDPDVEGELLPPPSNRFGEGGKKEDRSSTVSTSTLGIPFGENPFGPGPIRSTDQASPSDAEERSSWLGDEPSLDSQVARSAAAEDPFQDPSSMKRPNAEGERASIGGLSLLGQFEFDVGQVREGTPLPDGALEKVEMFK